MSDIAMAFSHSNPPEASIRNCDAVLCAAAALPLKVRALVESLRVCVCDLARQTGMGVGKGKTGNRGVKKVQKERGGEGDKKGRRL